MLHKLIARLRDRFGTRKAPATEEVAASPGITTRRGFLVFGLLLVTGVFLAGHSVRASEFSDIVAKFVGFVAEIALDLVGQLLLIMISALVWVAQYNGFVNSVPVAQGWSIVRDITNMFFIVVMLILAFGTILGVDSYSYKNGAVPKLLIMAVVVNFSRTICGLLIDASQVVMLTFVYGFKEAAGGNFADALGITQLMQMQSDGDKSVTVWTVAIGLVLGVIMTGIALMVVTVMTVSLAIRIVYLWLLVVLSPLAFLMRAVPGGQAKGNYVKWWKMFTAQIIFGPVLAFFLWLSLVSVASPDFTSTASGFAPAASSQEQVSGDASAAFQSTNIQKFIIAICLLLGGLKMANEIADNVSVATSAGGKVAGGAKKLYSGARSVVSGAGKVVGGGAAVAGAGAGLALGGANILSGGRVEGAKNWALTKAAKVPGVGGFAEAKMARDKVRNQGVAKKAAGKVAMANEEITATRAGRPALTMDAKIERNEYRKKRVQDLAKKASKGKLSDEEKNEYFDLAKNIRAHSKTFGDESGTKAIEEIEKKNNDLIFNKNEKDPEERKRMMAELDKSAASTTGQRLADMDSSGITQPFIRKVSSKQLLKALDLATGKNLEQLENMGFTDAEIEADEELKKAKSSGWTESSINYAKTKMDAKEGMFSYGSESERTKRVARLSDNELKAVAKSGDVQGADFGGAVLQNLVDNGRAGLVADKVAQTLKPEQLQGEGNALAQQIAEGIDSSALRALPENIASILRPLKAQVDQVGALESGASMSETFDGYEESKGFKNETSVRDFGQTMSGWSKGGSKEFGEKVSRIPSAAFGLKGGINDVSLSVINNLDVKGLDAMTKAGGGAQSSQLIATAHELSRINPNDSGAVKDFIAKNPGLRMSEKQIGEAISKSSRLLADVKGERHTPMAAAAKETNTAAKNASANSEKAAKSSLLAAQTTRRLSKQSKGGKPRLGRS